MKTPMELVQDACLEATAKGYLEPYEEMKSAALILARGIILRAGQLAPKKLKCRLSQPCSRAHSVARLGLLWKTLAKEMIGL